MKITLYKILGFICRCLKIFAMFILIQYVTIMVLFQESIVQSDIEYLISNIDIIKDKFTTFLFLVKLEVITAFLFVIAIVAKEIIVFSMNDLEKKEIGIVNYARENLIRIYHYLRNRLREE